jgi:hypothetical protein
MVSELCCLDAKPLEIHEHSSDINPAFAVGSRVPVSLSGYQSLSPCSVPVFGKKELSRKRKPTGTATITMNRLEMKDGKAVWTQPDATKITLPVTKAAHAY